MVFEAFYMAGGDSYCQNLSHKVSEASKSSLSGNPHTVTITT